MISPSVLFCLTPQDNSVELYLLKTCFLNVVRQISYSVRVSSAIRPLLRRWMCSVIWALHCNQRASAAAFQNISSWVIINS